MRRHRRGAAGEQDDRCHRDGEQNSGRRAPRRAWTSNGRHGHSMGLEAAFAAEQDGL